MPLQLPQFQPGQVPTAAPVQPFSPPNVAAANPAQLIMQAAQLRQQKRLTEQEMAHKNIESLTSAIQTAQSLKQQSTAQQQQHDIAQQTLDLHKQGELPLQQAEAKLKNLQADAMSKGIGAPYYTIKQASLMALGPDASPQSRKNLEDSLNEQWPNGVVDKSYADQMGMINRFTLGQQQKMSEYQQTQWSKLQEESPMNKGPRQAVGQAALNAGKIANVKAVLTKPDVTDDELHTAMQTLGGIMAGTGEEGAAKQELYGTAVSKYNKFMTEITATPQAARQPAVQQKLLTMMDDLQGVNNQKLEGHFQALRASHQSMLAQDPTGYMNWENATRLSMGLQPHGASQPSTSMPSTQPTQSSGSVNSGMNTLLNAAGLSNPAQPQQPGMPGGSQSAGNAGKIKVRRKADGSIGFLSPQYMNPSVYDQVP